MASNPAASSTSVFVQFYENGVTNVAVNGFPAVIVQQPSGHKQSLPIAAVQVTPEELYFIRDTMNSTSHDELKTLLEVMCTEVPGAKDFMTSARARVASLRSAGAFSSPTADAATAATALPQSLSESQSQSQLQVQLPAQGLPIPQPQPQPQPAAPKLNPAAALASLDDDNASPPAYELYPAMTIAEVWKEWRDGIGGWPSLRALEARWGAALRPTGRQRVAWSRRKGIIDEVVALVKKRRAAIAEGAVQRETEEETQERCVEELEERRGERSLHALLLELQMLKSKKD